jgi:hypothetical protein
MAASRPGRASAFDGIDSGFPNIAIPLILEYLSFSDREYLSFSDRFELEGDAVHAVALSGRARPIGKDMAKMAPTT